jgi:hypothetical protein
LVESERPLKNQEASLESTADPPQVSADNAGVSVVVMARRNALGRLLDFAKLVSSPMTAGAAGQMSSAIGKRRKA